MRIEHWLYTVPLRLRSLFRSQRVEEELNEELQYHIEQKTQQYVAQGKSTEEARRAALRDMDGLERHKEECRDMRRVNFVEDMLKDLRFGLRQLWRNPGFTAVAIITLALGIGANTAVFSVVNVVLLRPLAYPNADRLVVVAEKWPGGADAPSPADFLDIQAQNHGFDQMAAYREQGFNMASGEKPEHIQGTVVTTNTLSLLGVNPVVGRGFLAEDGGHAGNRAAILGYGLWEKRFGGRVDVLGQRIILNDQPFTIIGVMPPGFEFPEDSELWIAPRYGVPEHPLRPSIDPATMRGSHYFDVIARLRPGVTLEQARADLVLVGKNIGRAHPDSDLNFEQGPVLKNLHDDQVGQVRPALLVLLGAVGLVLLIACANVANLLLARGAARRKELGIRQALGASRGRVIRQLLTESVLLSAFAGSLGILVAFWAFEPLAALIPAGIRGSAEISLNTELLGFTAVISVFAGLVFGLFPALSNSRTELTHALKKGGRSSSFGLDRAQGLLVVAETSLALVLLAGAGLLLRSFIRLVYVNEGFSPSHVLTMRIDLPNASYPLPTQRAAFVDRMLSKIWSLPGVNSACVVTRLPLGGGDSSRSIQIEGHSYSPTSPDESIIPNYSVVSPGFFRTLQIPVVKGRDFTERDTSKAPGVFVINQTMARVFWPGQDPIGAQVKLDGDKEWSEVVGVIGDVRQFQLGEPPKPMLYAPYARDPWPFMNIAVRTAVDPASLTAAVEGAIRRVDKHEAIYDVRTMDDVVSESISPRRFDMLLLGLFAAVALTLAAVGIFGVMSFAVSQRTHEIGVCMALGAQKADVLKLVIGRGMVLTSSGVGIGVVAGSGLTRLMASLLYGVKPTDPLTFVTVSLVLAGVALLACYIPARRATKVDPMVALRYE